MPLLTETNVRAVARQTHDQLFKSYSRALESAADTSADSFDIFLSHSIQDEEIVRGVHILLERFGYTVYVDWIVDRELSRESVSRDTALHLKRRMRQCSALLYLATENSGDSKWMPWELGFFDGYSRGRVAILPVTKAESNHYTGQEYLSVYPYIDADTIEGTRRRVLWVNRSRNHYAQVDDWLEHGTASIRKHG